MSESQTTPLDTRMTVFEQCLVQMEGRMHNQHIVLHLHTALMTTTILALLVVLWRLAQC